MKTEGALLTKHDMLTLFPIIIIASVEFSNTLEVTYIQLQQ